jgi:hypothetical protein
MLERKFVRFRRLLSPQTTRARVTEGWLTAERSAEFQNLNIREPGESEIASSTSEFGLNVPFATQPDDEDRLFGGKLCHIASVTAFICVPRQLL